MKKEINQEGLFTPVDVISRNRLLKIEQNECGIRMTRIYYSRAFKWFYGSMIGISIICII